MDFVKVLDIAGLSDNQMVMVEAGGKEILLAKVDGAYHAINNKCTHMGGSLVEGVLKGNIVTCPRHGAQFDVRTGQAVGKASIALIKMKPRDEQGYVVKVEGKEILIGVPE